MTNTPSKKNFRQVAKVGELENGAMKEIKVEGGEIFLARVGDKYYAADNACPHMGGRLGQGTLEGTVVTCPRHASQFDLKDGSVIRWTDWAGIKASVGKLFRSPRSIVTHLVKVALYHKYLLYQKSGSCIKSLHWHNCL